MLKNGRTLEDAFLLQAIRDYEELKPRQATLEMDMHHGTDVVMVRRDGTSLPIGLTRKMEVEKIRRDASKAARAWHFWCEIIVPSSENEDLDIDNALSFIANDLKESKGCYALTCSNGSVHFAKIN